MIGDDVDIEQRLMSLLPRGWFADAPPVTSLLLSAIGAAWATIYNLIIQVSGFTRVSTCSGTFLDLASADFFGSSLVRKQAEADEAFVSRIKKELLRPRGTRAALLQAIFDVTGRAGEIVEPARPADTGGYATGGLAYGQAGAWGNLQLNHVFFITAYRPQGSGIAQLAGYGTGGPVIYGNMSMVATAVRDSDIYASVAAVLPLGSTGWVRLE